MTAHFLTFASNGFERTAAQLADSARNCGFDAVSRLGPDAIAGTDFAQRNRATLSANRGGGYWLWKPFIIRQFVDQLGSGDILLYSDAGRNTYYQFSQFPTSLLEAAGRSDRGFLAGVAIPHLGPIGKWTKRDCLQIMEADSPNIYNKAIVQTTWSVWTRTNPALDFLDKWLSYCEDSRCLTDSPNVFETGNLPNFVDHRHDQSICSILVHKLSAPFIDFSGSNVQRILELRPNSELSHMLYKRAQNVSNLLETAAPAILAREYLRLRSLR